MSLLKWDQFAAIGVDFLDDEHKKLINNINQLQKAIDTNARLSELMPLFDDLKKYTLLHFQHEEDMFTRSDYPTAERNAHMAEHAKLKAKLNDINQKLGGGDAGVLSQELIAFFVDWLIRHIQDYDMAYVPYVR